MTEAERQYNEARDRHHEPSPEYQAHVEHEEHLRAVATDERKDLFATNETIARAALYLGCLLNEIAAHTFPEYPEKE